MSLDIGAGAGGAEMLQQVLARKLQEQQVLAQQKFAQAKLAEDVRQADMQNAVQQGNLALGGRRVNEDVRQFDAGAPLRLAQQGHLGAETTELQRRPQAEREARDFTAGQNDANRTFQGEQGGLNRQNAVKIANINGVNMLNGIEARAAAKGAGGAGGDVYANERNNRITDTLDSLDRKVSGWTVGPGSVLAGIPGTQARDFSAELNKLKANIAFGELAEMRAASKTGGALGAVSDKEGTLLESALGALDQAQSPGALQQQFKVIRESLNRWNQAKHGGGGPAPVAVPASGGGDDAAARATALIAKYGG